MSEWPCIIQFESYLIAINRYGVGMMGKVALLIVLGLVAASVWWSISVSDVEQAKYTVVSTHDDIEVRDYAPMIVAQAEVSGERQKAIEAGFRLIADFIFGNNAPAKKVAMTAPVIQQPNQKIAMTAPVIQQGGEDKWTVQFVMPSEYTLDTLPKPNNSAVVLKEVPMKRYAVLRFSGFAEAQSVKLHSDKLSAFIDQQKLRTVSPMTYAFYNPPWTLPFLRRNEVMVEIER